MTSFTVNCSFLLYISIVGESGVDLLSQVQEASPQPQHGSQEFEYLNQICKFVLREYLYLKDQSILVATLFGF